MRIALVLFLMTAGIVVAEGFAQAETSEGSTIRVRLYDYVNLDRGTLVEAQRLAAGFYSAIGVTIDWASTMRPLARKKMDGDPGKLQDFTINILNREMVARTTWAKDAIGTAIVAPEGGGRIAYVLYDRLQQAATSAAWPETDLLALVIAHELGHLLLTPGIRSDGLMRPHWDVSELRRTTLRDLKFTPGEVALIRELLSERFALR